jgi:hypothetical protein
VGALYRTDPHPDLPAWSADAITAYARPMIPDLEPSFRRFADGLARQVEGSR